MSETLWRCIECGKWSHAKRRPKHHERFVSAEHHIEPEKVIRHVEGYQTAVDECDYGGWFVACGPFAEWQAYLPGTF